LRSLIDDIEELLALEKGDRYRLIDMRVRLEKNKRLYISDREFLENLVKTHLGRRGLSPDPDSPLASVRAGPATETSADTCTKCGSEISADEMFCTVCGAKKEEPSSVATPDVPKPTTQPKLEEYEKEYVDRVEKDAKAEGFSINADGEVGEKATRDTAMKKPKPEPVTKLETKLDLCTNCGFKMAVNEMFCINCGAKREADSTLSAPKPIPQPKPKLETESKPKPKPSPKPKPKPKPTTARKPTKKKAVHVKKSRKEELEEYEKKYLKKVETTAKKPKPTVAAEETSDSPEGEKHKLSLCVMCGGVISEEENFCTNCGSTR